MLKLVSEMRIAWEKHAYCLCIHLNHSAYGLGVQTNCQGDLREVRSSTSTGGRGPRGDAASCLPRRREGGNSASREFGHVLQTQMQKIGQFCDILLSHTSLGSAEGMSGITEMLNSTGEGMRELRVQLA